MRFFGIFAISTLIAAFTISSCGNIEPSTSKGSLDFCPKPQEIILAPEGSADFIISHKTVISVSAQDKEFSDAAMHLSDFCLQATNIRPKIVNKAVKGNAFVIERSKEKIPEGGYRLKIDDKKVILSASTFTGAMNGIHSIFKMLPLVLPKGSFAALPACEINDFPAFEYRAFMLDCGRHFFDIQTIKHVIDIISIHNLNYFHWHLTEDQGWRAEIKKYPLLTEIGSHRAGSPKLGGAPGEHDGIPVSGYYTQEQMREVVAYAAKKGITVIPEVDLPGHMQAALASYPVLGCTEGPYEVACRYGVLDDVLCAGKDNTLQFVKDVLDELMDIFPSKYIHLGGDECPKVRWEKCPHCQKKIKELGLKAQGKKTAEELLQSWFMDRAQEFLSDRGREMIVWNDVLVDWSNTVVGAPSKSSVIAGWMRPVSSEIAAKEGYRAILCPVGNLYFSNWELNRKKGEDYIRSTYDLDVSPASLSEEEKKNIIGVEACIWTERVSHPDSLLWRLLPRISVLSELQWSNPETKDYQELLPRLRRMTELYDKEGWIWNENAAQAWE